MAIASITADGEIVMEGESRPSVKKKKTRREREGIISTFEFLSKVPDEAAATEFLEKRRWGDTPTCPRCHSEDVARASAKAPMRWHCRGCRKYFSVRIGTVMERSPIPLRKWLYAIYLFHTSRKGISAKQLEKELGLTYRSAWFLGHRIREAMQYPGPLLAGEVEIDETFIGGKGRRKHFLKREDDRDKRENWGIPTHQMVLGIRERGGNVVMFPIGNRDAFTLREAISDNVESGSLIFTDGHASYRNMHAYDHDWVNHRKGEYVRDAVHTNSIESLWSLLKRAYMGTFHYMSTQHLHRYAAEFAHRQNAGPGNNLDTIGGTVDGMEGKRLTYKDLTGWIDIYNLPDWLVPADDWPRGAIMMPPNWWRTR